MLTIIETPNFTKLWPAYWSEDERGEFVTWLAADPQAGDVIPRSGGCRKIRWSRRGGGKRGGVRVVYYNQLAEGRIWLLLMYTKNVRVDIPPKVLKALERGSKEMTMPLSEDELIKRDSRRDIGKELLESVDQMKRGQVGFVHQVHVSAVASARIKAGLSQSQFAEVLGVSIRTLLDWERGKRRPAGAAKNLIAIAASHPEVLHELLEGRPAV